MAEAKDANSNNIALIILRRFNFRDTTIAKPYYFYIPVRMSDGVNSMKELGDSVDSDRDILVFQ